jgi:5-methylcytosine-specific restriction endonuclease McrA
MHGAICYNITNYIANGPALLVTAGTLSQDGVSVMTSPIVSPDSDNLKRCPKCGETKPRQSFAISKRRYDGLQVYCKQCNAAYRREHRADKVTYNKSYYDQHADSLREYARAYHHEHREERHAYRKVYYGSNRDRILAKQAIYNSSTEFKSRRSEYDRQHRQANKLKYSTRDANRRARERELGSYVTVADVELIRKSQTDPKGRLICWRCGKPIVRSPHLDHFIPLDKGGSHTPGNLHFMHAVCNLTKATKHPHELGMLI